MTINIRDKDYTPEEFGVLMGNLLRDFINQPQLPKTRYPLGKGILIWNLDSNYQQTVDKLVGLGVKWVAPKVVNAAMIYNSLYIDGFIKEARRAGIDVWGWGYTYGVNPVAEGQETAKIINNLDLSGYFIDVEGEYDKSGMTTAAHNYVNNLKSNTTKPLGLCSYRYPVLHQNVPWKVFLDAMDFHIPQVYWIQATLDTAPGYQLGRSYSQLKALKDLPYIPVGTVVKDDNSPWVPSQAQILNFGNTAKQLNLPGFGYYDLDSALPNLLEIVKGQ
jgi:hypothetical protein